MPNMAMDWTEWARLDGVALAALIRARQINPREVTAQVAAGVARLNPQLNAVLEIFADVLANPDADSPNRDGPLYGVPIFLKDLGSAMQGRAQEWGSALMAGHVAAATDPLVANFLAAGMVPLGRSTTPEYGLTFDTTTEYGGTRRITRNPWNLAHTPGGSSGGSAAAVAAGITPISMASDGGGSIRIPAAFSGLVGLKPARGRMPPPLARSEFLNRVSIEGVLTRTVRDTAVAAEALARIPNGGTFMPLAAPPVSFTEAITRDPAPLRIGLSTGRWGRGVDTDPQVTTRVRDLAHLLEQLGHIVEDLDDSTICDWSDLWWSYHASWVGSRLTMPDIATARGIPPADLAAHLTPITAQHVTAAQAYDAPALYKMMALNNKVTRQFGATLARHDVLLTPTMAIRVPQADGPYSLLRDEPLDIWIERLTNACRYTMPANETGLPAISIPAGFDTDGLPIGAQFYGNFAREDVILALAAQVERARPEWFSRVPPVHVTAVG